MRAEEVEPSRGATRPLPAGPVAYLVNQYPKVSHTFIRREIRALERLGVRVHRHALRGWDATPDDPEDISELRDTHHLLQRGLAGLFGPTLRLALRSPRAFGRGLARAARLARGAPRPWPWHLVCLAEACALQERLRGIGARHLHAHFGTNGAEVAALTRVLGGPPFSFTVHGPEEFDAPGALHLREKVAAAAFVVAISHHGRAQLLRWARPEDEARIVVVHCGLDARDLEAAPVPVPDVPRLVCIGRLCEQKGQLLLLEAVAALRRRDVDIEVVLAGDGDPTFRKLVEGRIAGLDLASCVRITGWLTGDAVRAELRAARALVLPSFAEGLPVVLMEAMACRRPVITTYTAGIPELVRDGESGWLVPAGDAGLLADAMQACLQAPTATLERMGEAGARRVAERHDADREAEKLARLFADAMEA